MLVSLVTPPSSLPISVGTLKQRAPALAKADDGVVEALIGAVVSHLDGYSGILGRCLVNQVWQVRVDGACNTIRVPFLNASDVEVRIMAGNTAIDILSADETRVGSDRCGLFIAPATETTWPTGGDAIEAEFTTGYGEPADVPEAIKQAIVLMVADLYAKTSEAGSLRSFEVQGAFTKQFNTPDQMSAGSMRAADMLLAPFRRIAV